MNSAEYNPFYHILLSDHLLLVNSVIPPDFPLRLLRYMSETPRSMRNSVVLAFSRTLSLMSPPQFSAKLRMIMMFGVVADTFPRADRDSVNGTNLGVTSNQE